MDSNFSPSSRGYQLDQGLLAATQRLTPEQRLDAFLIHSRLMMELFQAGQRARESRQLKST